MESTKTYRQIRDEKNNLLQPILFCIIIAIWLGYRPISGRFFGDTPTYAQYFYLMQQGDIPNFEGEWVWNHFMYVSAQIMDVSAFFFIG